MSGGAVDDAAGWGGGGGTLGILVTSVRVLSLSINSIYSLSK